MRVLQRNTSIVGKLLNIKYGEIQTCINSCDLSEALETFGYPYKINEIGHSDKVITVFGPNEILEFEIVGETSDNNRPNFIKDLFSG